MNDLHDDVKAAFDTVAADDTNPGSQVGSPASETLPPVEATPPPGEAPAKPRRADGTFAKADELPPITEPVKPPAGQQPPPAGQQPPALGTEAPVKLDPSKPPSAWTPGSKAQWNTIPLPLREEIIRREEATAAGIQKLQQQYEPAQALMDELTPYEDYVNHIKVDPVEYLHTVIQSEQTLRLGNPAQKLGILLALGDQYGVPIRSAVNQVLGGKLNETLAESHRRFQTPQALPPEIARELQEMRQWRSGMESQAAKSELDEFAKDHPLLPHVTERMAQLIESGAVETYQDAYDVAVYQNPQLRQQALALQNGQRQQGGIQQRQAAAASVVAPGSAPLEAGGDGVGDTDDVHEAVRRAWNASAGRA